jgi:hypothetical protein
VSVVIAILEECIQVAQRLGDTVRPPASTVMFGGDTWLIGIVMMCQVDAPFASEARRAAALVKAREREKARARISDRRLGAALLTAADAGSPHDGVSLDLSAAEESVRAPPFPHECHDGGTQTHVISEKQNARWRYRQARFPDSGFSEYFAGCLSKSIKRKFFTVSRIIHRRERAARAGFGRT